MLSRISPAIKKKNFKVWNFRRRKATRESSPHPHSFAEPGQWEPRKKGEEKYWCSMKMKVEPL